MALEDYFPDADLDDMQAHLNRRGAEVGVAFGELARLSNSRLALQAGEFARERGVYDAMHDALFRAFFVELRDIGDPAVLLDAGRAAGLEAGGLEELRSALDEERYAAVVEACTRQGRQRGVNALPTFFIGDAAPLVGAQPVDVFRQALAGAAAGGRSL